MSNSLIGKFVVNEDGAIIKAIHDRKRIAITRANCCGLEITFEHMSIKNADGSPIRLRRNGKTKVWKNRPDEFSIPVKYGLKCCLNINHRNCHEFYIVG